MQLLGMYENTPRCLLMPHSILGYLGIPQFICPWLKLSKFEEDCEKALMTPCEVHFQVKAIQRDPIKIFWQSFGKLVKLSKICQTSESSSRYFQKKHALYLVNGFLKINTLRSQFHSDCRKFANFERYRVWENKQMIIYY